MNVLQARKQTDHHYFFEDREPRSLVEKRFLECPDLIEPVTIGAKELVETRLESPIIPTIEEMVGCMAFMHRIPHDMRERPFWRGMGLMQYFVYEGANNPQREPECAEVRLCIAKQIGFLSIELPERFIERYL